MQQPTVLLLFGGESSEHDVSLSSAKNVYEAIDTTKYTIILSYITENGEWYRVDALSDITKTPDNQLSISLVSGKFQTGNGGSFRPDVILPILHGKNGEDGALQGLAQLLHIPIVGCDMTASVLAMDKVASKALFEEASMKVLPYHVHRAHDPILAYTEIKRTLGDVVFVKPSRAGSSVGVSKVTNDEEYQAAMQLALQHDSLVLIEQAARSPREIEVAVLGGGSSSIASTPGEIVVDREFYSYDSKYSETSDSRIVIPASLDSSQAESIKAQALIAYDALHCQGMARVDFLLDEDNTLYINEINTIPGFTNTSMYPKLWLHDGISYAQLIDRLILSALE